MGLPKDEYFVGLDAVLALLADRPTMNETHERINTRCPSCGNTTMFVGSGGLLVCSWLKCKNPSALNDAHERIAELEKLQAADRPQETPK